jgi:hypothetical protein
MVRERLETDGVKDVVPPRIHASYQRTNTLQRYSLAVGRRGAILVFATLATLCRPRITAWGLPTGTSRSRLGRARRSPRTKPAGSGRSRRLRGPHTMTGYPHSRGPRWRSRARSPLRTWEIRSKPPGPRGVRLGHTPRRRRYSRLGPDSSRARRAGGTRRRLTATASDPNQPARRVATEREVSAALRARAAEGARPTRSRPQWWKCSCHRSAKGAGYALDSCSTCRRDNLAAMTARPPHHSQEPSPHCHRPSHRRRSLHRPARHRPCSRRDHHKPLSARPPAPKALLGTRHPSPNRGPWRDTNVSGGVFGNPRPRTSRPRGRPSHASKQVQAVPLRAVVAVGGRSWTSVGLSRPLAIRGRLANAHPHSGG